jgi:hypothetical protein
LPRSESFYNRISCSGIEVLKLSEFSEKNGLQFDGLQFFGGGGFGLRPIKTVLRTISTETGIETTLEVSLDILYGMTCIKGVFVFR